MGIYAHTHTYTQRLHSVYLVIFVAFHCQYISVLLTTNMLNETNAVCLLEMWDLSTLLNFKELECSCSVFFVCGNRKCFNRISMSSSKNVEKLKKTHADLK